MAKLLIMKFPLGAMRVPPRRKPPAAIAYGASLGRKTRCNGKSRLTFLIFGLSPSVGLADTTNTGRAEQHGRLRIRIEVMAQRRIVVP
jgi:hypothetical protein